MFLSFVSPLYGQTETIGEYAYQRMNIIAQREQVLNARLRIRGLSQADRGAIESEKNNFLAPRKSEVSGFISERTVPSPSEAYRMLGETIDILNYAINSNNAFLIRDREQELTRSAGAGFLQSVRSDLEQLTQQRAQLIARQNAFGQRAANLPGTQGGPSGPLTDECESLVVRCENETAEAKTQCDVDDNTNLRNSRSSLSQFGNAATQVASMAAQANSTTPSGADGSRNGLASNCNMMANVAAGVNGALGGYRMFCLDAFDTCKSACSEIRTRLLRDRSAITSRTALSNSCAPNEASITSALERVDTKQTECNRLSGRAREATTLMQGAAANLLTGATRCIENTVAGGLEAYCRANPGMAVCAGLGQNPAINCDDGSPASAAATVCICRKNPFASQCRSEVAQNRAAPSGVIGGAPLSGGASGPTDFGAGIDGQAPIQANLTPGQEVGGKKMSLPGVAAGDGLQAGDGGGPGSRAPFDPFSGPKIFGRAGGGSEGQNPWGSKKAGGGAGAGVYGRFNTGMSDGTLKDFLPNGSQDPNRGLASMGGILGPNVNIWEKINNRYVDHSLTKQSLLPSNYQATPQELQQRKPGN
ncbi:MAG: hypothetical protein ACK5WZ_02600 [Pseudobdellovibrionaceae bacterium]